MAVHRSSLRTRSFEESIKVRVENGPVTLIDYQPGNGSRYTLTFTRIEPGDGAALLGLARESGGYVVSYEQGETSQVFSLGGYVHWTYVRLIRRQADQLVLAEIIASIVGAEALTPEQYEQQELEYAASADDDDE